MGKEIDRWNRVLISLIGFLVDKFDRITACLRNVRVDGKIIVALFQELSPLLTTSMSLCSSEQVCEKVVRCYKYVIRSSPNAFVPLAPMMFIHLSEKFQQIPVSAFIYAASVCIAAFSRPEHIALKQPIYVMVLSISSSFFSRLSTVELFQQHPDLVEEYFYLMARMVQYFPGLIYSDPASPLCAVANAGVAGLQLRHKEAQKGILQFFERLLEPIHASESSESSQSGQQSVLVQLLPQLLQAMFMCLSGDMPAYAVEGNNGSIANVLWNTRNLNGTNLQVLKF